jgi:glycosyltransferase involved in cell wall biosynthesis
MLNNNIKLSIIIPCYNEKNTIVEILGRIKKITFINKEIIIVMMVLLMELQKLLRI